MKAVWAKLALLGELIGAALIVLFGLPLLVLLTIAISPFMKGEDWGHSDAYDDTYTIAGDDSAIYEERNIS